MSQNLQLFIANSNTSNSGRLKEKQQDYQERQNHMTKDDEDAYRGWCSEGNFFLLRPGPFNFDDNLAMFRIQILEMRLNRHKMNAPRIYAEMDTRLKTDPRLKVY